MTVPRTGAPDPNQTARNLRAELRQRDEEVARLRADLAAARVERDAALDEARDQLHLARHLESLGTLSAAVAHDFNNMLTVILSFADLVLSATPGTDPRHEDVLQISRAAHRATKLTSQLLTFSRQQSWRPRVLAVDEVLRDLERPLRRLAGDPVSIALHLGAPHTNVLVDPARLEQVITNLVANARDAMPDGGSLTIRTELRDLDRRRPEGGFGELAEGRYLSLAFVDTGMGMPPEVQARIFEPYFTTKGGRGTGLGLSTVFGIVQQAGGAVCVTTVPGLGSTFEVLLPQATQPSELLVLRALAEARAGTETLLLVERDDLVRAAAATILRARGYVVLEAMDGADALQVSATHPGPIELLLADPSATDDGGVDLVHALGRVRPELRTLYLSGPPGPAPSGTSPMAWLPKPFTADTLSHRVRELLDEH